uniref:Uncharacterized protein n=1 Tax=Mycena chlorophos TaxID=658473 RepID=A0ABQ0LCU4_MYCCL|nr:predicted protein [Mycena chlorophos]
MSTAPSSFSGSAPAAASNTVASTDSGPGALLLVPLTTSTPAPIPALSSSILLSQYTAAGAADPSMAALSHVQSEKQSLHTKNEQLWKLIERQRTGYNQLVAELERARKERDAYRAQLKAVVGGGTEIAAA